MDQQTHTFASSSREFRDYFLGLGVLLTLIVIVVSVLKVADWNGLMIAVVAGMVASVWLFGVSLPWFLLANFLRGLRLQIGPDGVCRQQGAVSQMVPWGEITRLRIRRGWLTGRSVQSIEVYTAEGQALWLRHFERLDEIVRLLQAGVGPGAHVQGG